MRVSSRYKKLAFLILKKYLPEFSDTKYRGEVKISGGVNSAQIFLLAMMWSRVQSILLVVYVNFVVYHVFNNIWCKFCGVSCF